MIYCYELIVIKSYSWEGTVLGYLNPVCADEGNLLLIFFTAQTGNTILTDLPSQPQHHLVSC